ncbi:MAG: 4Fe-4S dicluster domain-containing protein [Clostridia bacterium]|nr:4Fe-4S dicluster domain-containing protein [Clostridia bacterium]
MKKIKKENLDELFSFISGKNELYVPVKIGAGTNFALYEEGTKADLDTLKTVKSPKDIFFPQSETLYTCTKEEGKMKITAEELKSHDFVVFGMRGCDVAGLEVLDKVFLSEPIDTFYAARRDHGVIVTAACSFPEESCFCSVFGIDAANPLGDAVYYMVGDELIFDAKTEKGEKFLELIGEFLIDGGDKEAEYEKAKIKEIIKKLPYSNLSLSGWNGDATDEKFNSPLWEDLYKGCLACGTCTFSCPTCQCYDIKDYTTGNGVMRYRCWDSCMYSDFTMMAHGNNRTSQMQRFRQRFMHKLVYFPANNDGKYSCVGCGRCVDKCPSALNIVKVIKAFGKEGK